MARRYREPWGQCSTCGFDVPVSRLRYHRRRGWQCIGAPGANCWDGRMYDEAYYVPRPFEGVRRTTAPLTNTLTEGV